MRDFDSTSVQCGDGGRFIRFNVNILQPTATGKGSGCPSGKLGNPANRGKRCWIDARCHSNVSGIQNAQPANKPEGLELRYNRTRLHSELGYRTPQEVMDEYLNRQEAA